MERRCTSPGFKAVSAGDRAVLASLGANIVIIARNEAKLREAKDEITRRRKRARSRGMPLDGWAITST